MPRTPSISAFSEINFVTRALLLGCEVPFGMFIELAKPALYRLAILLFVPDGFDIAQAIFDPRKGRRRKPSRKGRKRNRGAGFPDVSDIIGGTVDADIGLGTVIPIGPGRYFFTALNTAEAINISVAITEIISDISFPAFLGAFKVGQADCASFPAIHRSIETPQGIFTGGGLPVAFPFNTLNFNTGMLSNNVSIISPDEPFSTSMRVTATPDTGIAIASGYIQLIDQFGNILSESLPQTASAGQLVDFEVITGNDAGNATEWRWVTTQGKWRAINGDVLAFSTDLLPWI